MVRDYCHVHGDGLPPGGRGPGIFDPATSLTSGNPIRAQAPRSRVYSYYNPDVGAESEPFPVEVD